MKITLTSDIHTEFYAHKLSVQEMLDLSIPSVNADVIILAGDILNALDLARTEASSKYYLKGKYLEFFQEIKNRFDTVLMVLGNHEHYRYRYENTCNTIRDVLGSYVTVLDNDTYTLTNGEIVWGGTMWTDFNGFNPLHMYQARNSMNDYRLISQRTTGYTITPEFIMDRFLEYKNGLLNSNANIVITHHAPSFASINEKWRGDVLNSSYASVSLDGFILDSGPRLWVHGHLHDACDYMLGNTRIVCNPLGYHEPGRGQEAENSGFNRSLIL